LEAEQRIIVERENSRMATEALLLRMAVASVVVPLLSGKNDAAKEFSKWIKRLQDDGER
jgi:hypothetical protein